MRSSSSTRATHYTVCDSLIVPARPLPRARSITANVAAHVAAAEIAADLALPVPASSAPNSLAPATQLYAQSAMHANPSAR